MKVTESEGVIRRLEMIGKYNGRVYKVSLITMTENPRLNLDNYRIFVRTEKSRPCRRMAVECGVIDKARRAGLFRPLYEACEATA